MKPIEIFPTPMRDGPSRRTFLKAAAALAFVRPLSAATSRPPKRKIVVGAHPWVYAAPLPNYDFTPVLPQIFADFSYAGLDGIELMHQALRHDDAVERIGELSVRHRLPIIGTSLNAGAMWDRQQHPAVLDYAEKIITRVAQLDGRTLGTSVGALPPGRAPRKTPEELDAQAGVLLKLRALCERNGVVLNLHNHTYQVENGLHDLKGTLERLPDVKLGSDLNWLVRGGVDPAAFIRQYGRQIVFMHVRDQHKDGRWSEALGEGDTDFAAITAALREADFTGDAIIELAHEQNFKSTRPLRESFKLSREFIRRTLEY